MVSLPPLSVHSVQGWMISASTCAPTTPRRAAGSAVGDLFGGNGHWETTTRTDYLGHQSPREQRARPSRREPTTNLLYGPKEDMAIDRFSCTSHVMHTNPGNHRREIVPRYSNAPSEMDHPLFGLHDPGRAERLGGSPARSLSTDSYLPHVRSAYVTAPSEPPYADTASLSWNDSWRMRDQLTEKQANFRWPPSYVHAKRTPKPPSELQIA